MKHRLRTLTYIRERLGIFYLESSKIVRNFQTLKFNPAAPGADPTSSTSSFHAASHKYLENLSFELN